VSPLRDDERKLFLHGDEGKEVGDSLTIVDSKKSELKSGHIDGMLITGSRRIGSVMVMLFTGSRDKYKDTGNKGSEND
jgi:hypothetical protein